MDNRMDSLGFVPQKEIIYNKFLPYAEQLDSESQIYLSQIKTNLGKAILYHHLRDFSFWTDHLAKYVRLYGLKFSKEDHINFIKVLFELMLIPNLELNIVAKVSVLLTSLLKKIELLSRDDLIIPWRPLYDLYDKILYSLDAHLGISLIPSGLEKHMRVLIRVSRAYFSLESTEELLDELRPLICPFDESMTKAMSSLELFLCTKLPPAEHHRGFKLWFDELMGLWHVCHNSPSWENNLLWLFSRLAKDNIGYIDWEPYIPMIFTKLLRSFQLPGRATKVAVNRINVNFDTTPVCTWIISMLGPGSSCQVHINRFFKAVESYYHPSNFGKYLIKLQKFLHYLPLGIVKRLHVERYSKPSWLIPSTPESKLTEDDITQFVKSVLPAALLSIFSKCGCTLSASALQNLALLRPQLVIPPTLERMYSSLETLTEPHRLTASFHCVVAVARTLVKKNKHFPDGPRHVIPLLMAALPGIDPNDIRKCMMTFQFISTFSILVLLKDCSGAVSNPSTELTEEEQEMCLATAAFEDFVLQFMDRCFALIENSSMENPSTIDRDTQKTNPEENFMEIGLYSTFGTILTQSSPPIYEAALMKLRAFVSSHILEIKVSGKYAANMCRSASRANPELALKTFVPYYTKLVLALTENDDVLKEEKLDDELLFSLLLLSEVVRCNGKHLLKHQSDLQKVLHRTLHLKCREGYVLSCALLKNVLKAYTLMYPTDSCSVVDPWNRYNESEQHRYLEDWGRPGDIDNLGVKFHVITDTELAAAQELLETFLVPELHKLRSWTLKIENLSREEVQNSLNIINDCLLGAANCLPIWPEERIQLRESSVPSYCVSVLECGSRVATVEGGKNVRHFISEVVRDLLDYICKNSVDDTKSLTLVIKLYSHLMFYWGASKEELDTRWKAFRVVKKALENKLNGKKKHIRALLIDRAYLQDELRITERNKSFYTKTHGLLMKDLLSLSISHYSDIRIHAQNVLQKCVFSFRSSYTMLMPDIMDLLKKDPIAFHEEFKGVLHVILGQKQLSLLLIHNWEMVKELWPLIAASKHSEKPSIIKLIDCISNTLQKFLLTSQIKLEIPKSCLEAAKLLWSNNTPLPSQPCLSEAECEQGLKDLGLRCETDERNYLELLRRLIELINDGKLHWRHYQLTLTMMLLLIRSDVHFPKEAVQLFVGHLKHETLAVRKIAICAMCAILQQQKRKHKKVELDPSTMVDATVSIHPVLTETSVTSIPKNFWLQYNSVSPPNTQHSWDARHFVHKTNIGFYQFPKKFKVYQPYSEQPQLDRNRDELTEEEKPIFDEFSQQAFVDSLMSYFSLEERKGLDKFDDKKFYMFKNLFRNFGRTFLPLFLPHLKTMVEDKQESPQRCAAEIISALVRGSNHWSFAQSQNLQEQLVPILRSAINSITPETLADWSTCITSALQNRDPNQYYWLFELIMEEPSKVEHGSFLESSWIHLLLGLLSQQEWRVNELLHRVLLLLKPKLNHSYQNVREKIGNLLSNIFMYEVPIATESLAFVPSRAAMIEFVLPMFAALEYTENGFIKSACGEDNTMEVVEVTEESEEKKHAKNVFRTVCRWLLLSVTRTLYCAPPEVFKFLPLICMMQNDTLDENLQRDCIIAAAVLGQASLNADGIDAAIETLKSICVHNSWRSRSAAVSFLQIMVFSNLFNIMKRPHWVKDVCDMVLKLLEDERIEVREAAAETLGGFLHCEFIKITDDLLVMFKKKCRRNRWLKESASKLRCTEPDKLKERHAGILGLCACVDAFPYDVPEFLPNILMELSDHLHDPQPIETTIKKTLSSFRRTHYDNWRDHKLKFTDDQLAVITDLLVSPNYYA